MTNPSAAVLTAETIDAVTDLLRACVAEGVGLSISPLPKNEGAGWQVGWMCGRSGGYVAAGRDLATTVRDATPQISGAVAEWRAEAS